MTDGAKENAHATHGEIWVRWIIVGLCIMATLAAAYFGYSFTDVIGLKGILEHVTVWSLSVYTGVSMYLAQYIE